MLASNLNTKWIIGIFSSNLLPSFPIKPFESGLVQWAGIGDFIRISRSIRDKKRKQIIYAVEDCIRTITVEPHPFDSGRVILVIPDRELVREVTEAFRRATRDLSHWKVS